MRIFHGSKDLRGAGPFAVAIGIFDGVHRGHQVLLRTARQLAEADHLESLAYTFHPHPAQVLAPELAPRLIEPLETRLQRLQARGLDAVLVEAFDVQFAATAPQDFIRHILVAKLQARHVIVGEGFTFGARQSGNVELLTTAGAAQGFTVHAIPPVKTGGVVVSSTKIREFVTAGQLQGAALLLGRAFSLTGVVQRGAGRGAKLGIPTANLEPHTQLLPAIGVYAAMAEGPFGRKPAVVNIGINPTFGGAQLKVEAHVLDIPNRPLYGGVLSLEFRERLRDEQRFDGVEALKAQIAQDIATAREVLSKPEAQQPS